MRIPIAMFVVCALTVPALAQAPQLVAPLPGGAPSKTLERAIKLYDKTDYYSATIELNKVLTGESGDDARNKQRAEFYWGKALYQMKFYAPSWSRFLGIVGQADHPYRDAVAKWVVALLRVAPNASVRSVLFAYRDGSIIDDPAMASVRDELAYQLGRELASRDVPANEAIAMLAKVSESSSPFAPRALLEIAAVKLRTKDLDGGTARAIRVAHVPELAIEAARLVASWAHIHGEPERARAALGELAKTSAYARYQLSRVILDGRPEVPGLARVPIETFDAVMLPSACRTRGPADIKPVARQVIGEAKPLVAKLVAIDDNNLLYDEIRKLQQSPSMPGNDVVIAALADPVMQEQLAWKLELDKEIEQVQRADRAWQTTPAAAEVLQELTLLQSVQAADVGALARQRIVKLASGLDALEAVLAGASPAFALTAGPDAVLVVTSELCARGGTAPAIASSSAVKPQSGCAGCATTRSSASMVVLVAMVLATITRRGRRRAAR